MKTKNTLLVLALSALLGSSFAASAAQSCATGVGPLLKTTAYSTLNTTLTPTDVSNLTTAMKLVSNDAQYQVVLDLANAIAAKAGATGRVVITLPDGTVVVDTKKTTNNTYANFSAKAINENHNSRIAILDAQLWPCGVGVETKFSTSTGAVETSLARRLGGYLNSVGTVRVNN